MLNKNKIILAVFLCAAAAVVSGCGLRGPKAAKVDPLEIWGVWDDSDVMNDFINDYKAKNDQITEIKYRKLTYDEYESELVRAFAAGKGPDIFIAHHTWTAKHSDLMVSLEEAQSAYNTAVSEKGGCSKPPVLKEPLLTKLQYSQAFVDVAYNDFVKEDKIYGVPLAVDTLALYYNKDLFAAAGIAEPPKTWDEFQADARLLTIKDQFNNITQAGAAIGTAANVNRPGDILAMMMMQLGCPMVNTASYTSEINARRQLENSREFMVPAVEAMRYYTSFADGRSPNYTWNLQMHNSIDLFQEGKAAMMINYTYAVDTIRMKAPKLNFAVAEIPQLPNVVQQGKMSYANYWGYVVSRESLEKKNKPIEAWKFLRYLGEKEQVLRYVQATRRPASRKDVIKEQQGDPDLGIFATQALMAKSWFQSDERKVDELLNSSIDSVILEGKTPEAAVDNINTKLNVLLKEYKDKMGIL